ncbi:MAG: murein L,D-transpeptidase, partial [Oxalobacteraceae bacterium]
MNKMTALTLIAALGGTLTHAIAQQPAPLPPAAQPATTAQNTTTSTAVTAAPGAVQDPAIAEQAEFEKLLRAQVLLERIYLSPGELDGAYGSNLRQALTTFQT